MVIVDRIAALRQVAVALLAGGVLTLALVFAPSASAAASPASCVGHEASGVSPPGSSEEAPGGVLDILAFIRANYPGTVGGFISTAARVHAGSHEACDEALG
jgi:hypothetical protein